MPEYVTLFCQEGQHDWKRERKRGARPKNCPEHQTLRDELDREEQQRKMQEGRERAQRERNAAKIATILEKSAKAGLKCNCRIKTNMTYADLRKMGAGCTDPMWCCPVLDRVRREMETD